MLKNLRYNIVIKFIALSKKIIKNYYYLYKY